MALTGDRTFVGFGFGAIQAGLFLYEAFQSGAFGRLVVAEVMPEVVHAVRRSGGLFAVNIAHPDRIQAATVGPVAIEDPAVAADRERLIAAVAEAHEIATAVPSVDHYVTPGPGSLHAILAAGLRRKAASGGPLAVVYTAENRNRAAETLAAAVLGAVPAGERAAVARCVCFVNTVIGKMSGLAGDAPDLAPVTPESRRAFLVEAFNRILVGKVHFPAGSNPPFDRGLAVFEEKDDLLPFEEAKLYGHNAAHALAAYLGAAAGASTMAELAQRPGLLAFVRAAALDEAGAALMQRHAGRDPIFTPAGFTAYMDDLLVRMTNPFLRDTVARVGRDPERKLGWDDRLIGTMRLALEAGLRPQRLAMGAAAALAWVQPADSPAARRLRAIWGQAADDASQTAQVIALVEEGAARLHRWQAAGCPPLATWYIEP